jgi:hypothetical protein
VPRPVGIDPVRSHNDQVNSILDGELDDFLGPVPVDYRLIDLQAVRLESFRAFLQALASAVFQALVKRFHFVERDVLDRFDDVNNVT